MLSLTELCKRKEQGGKLFLPTSSPVSLHVLQSLGSASRAAQCRGEDSSCGCSNPWGRTQQKKPPPAFHSNMPGAQLYLDRSGGLMAGAPREQVTGDALLCRQRHHLAALLQSACSFCSPFPPSFGLEAPTSSPNPCSITNTFSLLSISPCPLPRHTPLGKRLGDSPHASTQARPQSPQNLPLLRLRPLLALHWDGEGGGVTGSS